MDSLLEILIVPAIMVVNLVGLGWCIWACLKQWDQDTKDFEIQKSDYNRTIQQLEEHLGDIIKEVNWYRKVLANKRKLYRNWQKYLNPDHKYQKQKKKTI